MTIGEKIAAFRASHNMSQGDLAEKLNVSRQSISKWETNSSIPELDKLIQLSDLFQISIDELVRGGEPSGAPADTHAKEAAPQPQAVPQHAVSTQRVVGFILLGIGLLCCVLAAILGRGFLLIGGYLIACSLVCLLTGRHAALIIGWATFLLFLLLGPYYTGIHILFALKQGLHPGNRFAALLCWLLLACLVFFTVRAFKKK